MQLTSPSKIKLWYVVVAVVYIVLWDIKSLKENYFKSTLNSNMVYTGLPLSCQIMWHCFIQGNIYHNRQNYNNAIPNTSWGQVTVIIMTQNLYLFVIGFPNLTMTITSNLTVIMMLSNSILYEIYLI